MTHKIEIKPDRRKSQFGSGLLYNGAREIFVDGELWGRVYPEYHGCHGQTHVLHQCDPGKDNPDRCYRIGIGKNERTAIRVWSDKHYLGYELPSGEKPVPLKDRIQAMVVKAIKDGHLRSPTVIRQERKAANERLQVQLYAAAAAKQDIWAKRAAEAVNEIGEIATAAHTDAVLKAMKWAVDNA
jgi:hypothetical protein